MVELAQLLVSGIVLVFLGSGQDVDVVLGALVDLFVVKRVLQHVQVAGQGDGVADEDGVDGLDDPRACGVIDQLELELLGVGNNVVGVAAG